MAKATMTANVRTTLRDVWAQVQEALDARRTRPSRRDICEETIWTLARSGRLRTPAERKLYDAVAAYFKEYLADPDEPLEVAIYKAYVDLKTEQAHLHIEADLEAVTEGNGREVSRLR